MEQLSINGLEEKKEIKSCVFTGHRILKDGFSKNELKREIVNAVEQGVETFYNGVAMGFDLIAAETVLGLKKRYPQIKLVACVPCYNQEKNFSGKDKKRYADVLKKADETIVLSQNYYKGCMLARNRYMADRADCMIAYCKSETGGTAFTVRYFQQRKPTAKIAFL